MLQKPITYMYRVYITLPLQGRHKHLASQSIHMDRIHIPPRHIAGHRSARWTKNYNNNDDDVGEDRYNYMHLLSRSYYCYIVRLS